MVIGVSLLLLTTKVVLLVFFLEEDDAYRLRSFLSPPSRLLTG